MWFLSPAGFKWKLGHRRGGHFGGPWSWVGGRTADLYTSIDGVCLYSGCFCCPRDQTRAEPGCATARGKREA